MLLRVAICVCMLGFKSVQGQARDPESEIRAARLGSNRAIQAHDAQSFGNSLDDDFVMIRGNGVLVPSRQAYIDLFSRDFADPKAIRYERITDKIEISIAAPLAAEHGHWEGKSLNGRTALSGTYLAMWRNTAAGWKLRSELFVVLDCERGPSCAGYRKP